jgi:hypothetical protein
MRLPDGEPQSENPDSPCSRSRRRPHYRRRCWGGSGSWWRGRSKETLAQPPELEREENRAGGSGPSFAVPAEG